MHSRRRLAFRLFVAALVGALGFSGLGWLTSRSERARSQTLSDGYAIEVVHVGYAEDPATGATDPSSARVQYRVAWETNEYPGLRQCIWQVRDSVGRIIGTVHGTLEALQAEYDRSFAQIVPVRGEPATADVRCDSSRLDNPERRLRTTNLELKEGSDVPNADYSVGFDIAWTSGRGNPTPQTCEIRVYDQSGDLLFTQERGLGADEGTRHMSLPVFLPEDTEGEPASAAVTCSPMRG